MYKLYWAQETGAMAPPNHPVRREYCRTLTPALSLREGVVKSRLASPGGVA